IVRLQEDPQLRTGAPVGLINVLEGVSPDYAVVAQKAADPDALARFDAAFSARRGITLGQLALRYEDQLAGRDAEIHHILARVERHGTDLAQQLASAQAQAQELHH
ncbi:methyltransferase type 11, partial [Massilia sp. CT11-108]